MKKEYLILILLILSFSAYLFLHKEDTDNTMLPEIKKIDVEKMTGIVLSKKEGPLKFFKEENKWTITDNAYPADLSSVKSMLDTIKEVKLSALVSQKGNLERYELDEDNRIQVKVTKNQDTLFEFSIGKTAPTANHTFVMVTNNKNVYHANGSFRSHFDKTLEDFRDKKVVEFKEKSIKQFTIEKDGLSKTLISHEEKKDKEASSMDWKFQDGSSADKAIVSNLLSSVSFLKCEKYLDAFAKNELQKEAPLLTIRFENEEKNELILYKAKTKDNFLGMSSMNEYAFALNSYTGKEIVSNSEKLLGLETEQENDD